MSKLVTLFKFSLHAFELLLYDPKPNIVQGVSNTFALSVGCLFGRVARYWLISDTRLLSTKGFSTGKNLTSSSRSTYDEPGEEGVPCRLPERLYGGVSDMVTLPPPREPPNAGQVGGLRISAAKSAVLIPVG